jgi:hypothetical protein
VSGAFELGVAHCGSLDKVVVQRHKSMGRVRALLVRSHNDLCSVLFHLRSQLAPRVTGPACFRFEAINKDAAKPSCESNCDAMYKLASILGV